MTEWKLQYINYNIYILYLILKMNICVLNFPTDSHRVQTGLIPAAVWGHAVDPGGALCPCGGPGPLSPGPLQPLRPLQAGQEQWHWGGRPQPVQCYVVCLGGPAQQRHWRRWGKSFSVELEKFYLFLVSLIVLLVSIINIVTLFLSLLKSLFWRVGRHPPEFQCPGPGDGVGRVRDDHCGVLHS